MKFDQTVLSENFFRRFGHIFAPHLQSLGIDDQVLERTDCEIPEERYIALWEAVGQVNPNAGLEIGSQTEANDFGALGHALFSVSSVGKALETLHQFIVVFAQRTRIDFELNDQHVVVEYQVDEPTVIHRRQDAEFGISSILRLLQLITKREILPDRVDLEHEKPNETSTHKSLFQCPIFFDQPTNRLYFSRDILKLPISQCNERLYQALEPYLEREREKRSTPDDLIPQITRMIAADLSNGVPSLSTVSEQLCLSRRTLQRRLNERGIEFSSLVEDVRRELGLSYVKNIEYSVTEIAMLLGYAESGSFSRAFRRWTGSTPMHYRSNLSS